MEKLKYNCKDKEHINMNAINEIICEIEKIKKNTNNIVHPELSSLAKIWNTPEEDKAWACLNKDNEQQDRQPSEMANGFVDEQPEEKMMICENAEKCKSFGCGHREEHVYGGACYMTCTIKNHEYKCIEVLEKFNWQELWKAAKDIKFTEHKYYELIFYNPHEVAEKIRLYEQTISAMKVEIENLEKIIEKQDNVYKDLLQINQGNMNVARDRLRVINELQQILKEKDIYIYELEQNRTSNEEKISDYRISLKEKDIDIEKLKQKKIK